MKAKRANSPAKPRNLRLSMTVRHEVAQGHVIELDLDAASGNNFLAKAVAAVGQEHKLPGALREQAEWLGKILCPQGDAPAAARSARPPSPPSAPKKRQKWGWMSLGECDADPPLPVCEYCNQAIEANYWMHFFRCRKAKRYREREEKEMSNA